MPENPQINLPKGFQFNVFAEGLQNPRGIAVAPNGDVFIAESAGGRISILHDPDKTGKSVKTDVFAEELNYPFGLLFHKDWLYVGQADKVVRYRYKTGAVAPEGEPQVILSKIPTSGHRTRTLAYNPKNDKMYITIGSSGNILEETDERRATICEFSPDGSGFRVFATGIRNAVGLAIHPKTNVLWTSVMERDGLGDDLVPDFFTSVKEGGFYGWPYYYANAQHDPKMPDKPELKAKHIAPEVLITAHASPLLLTFYTGKQFPKEYQGDAFIALHGSGNRAKRTGYNIIQVPFKNGKPEGGYYEFATGWMFGEDDPRAWGRPVGIAQAADGSLLITDDAGNRVFRITYKK